MGNKLSRSVSIIGVGYTPLGDVRSDEGIKDFTERELYAAAALEAMDNAGIRSNAIDAFYVGMVAPNYWAKTLSTAPQFGEWVGMADKPTLFHDEGCATSMIGFQQAVQAVASGQFDCVLSGGATIVQSEPKQYLYPPFQREAYDPYDWWWKVQTGNDICYEKIGGEIAASIDANNVMYCQQNHVAFDDLHDAMITYLQVERKAALRNPRAVTVTETYEEEAARFGFSSVRDYLLNDQFDPRGGTFGRALYSGKFVDGASAIIVCETELAKKICKRAPVEVAGVASGSTTARRGGTIPGSAYTKIFKNLYDMADITDPFNEVQYFSAHDCPCTQIFLVGEYAGYFPKGEGWKYMLEGRTAYDQDRPCQTSGGRTQLGHPVAGAIGVEITEAVNQIRGESTSQMPTPPKCAVIDGGGQGINLGACCLRAL